MLVECVSQAEFVAYVFCAMQRVPKEECAFSTGNCKNSIGAANCNVLLGCPRWSILCRARMLGPEARMSALETSLNCLKEIENQILQIFCLNNTFIIV